MNGTVSWLRNENEVISNPAVLLLTQLSNSYSPTSSASTSTSTSVTHPGAISPPTEYNNLKYFHIVRCPQGAINEWNQSVSTAATSATAPAAAAVKKNERLLSDVMPNAHPITVIVKIYTCKRITDS